MSTTINTWACLYDIFHFKSVYRILTSSFRHFGAHIRTCKVNIKIAKTLLIQLVCECVNIYFHTHTNLLLSLQLSYCHGETMRILILLYYFTAAKPHEFYEFQFTKEPNIHMHSHTHDYACRITLEWSKEKSNTLNK